VGDRFCLTDSVGRQLGLYGLRDGRVAAFAVHRTTDPALPADTRSALRAEYGTLGWVAPEALAQCPPPDQVYYDHVAQIEMPAWHRDRVVLAGDACAAVSLLAGQGAALGIAGAYLLADRLHHARTVADGLESYERLWRPVMAEKQLTARNGARWFLPRSAVELWGRRAVLALSRLPGLDHLVARSLAGKPTAVIADLRRRSGNAGVSTWR
jgi:2-polyprenyl-6-methoxyphenol hydroxylase-like FAD-dependent oxidoreductase